MINANLPPEGKKYKTPRNFASGFCSSSLTVEIAAQRHIQFVAWKLVSGYDKINLPAKALNWLETLGFTVVPRIDRFRRITF